MIIYVDFDGVLAKTDGMAYLKSEPMYDNIQRVNKLYDEGNIIVIYTARGSITGLKDYFREITLKQIKKWGVKYHELNMDKPYYDMFIDDRSATTVPGKT